MLLSHDHHSDNLDRAGRRLLASAHRVLTTVAGAVRLGAEPGLAPWQTTTLVAPSGAALRVTATPPGTGQATPIAAR